WLDITSPTALEMKSISQLFGIHALTTEDIMNQEIREKCDSFRDYLFVSFRAFVHDENQLTPINFYNIVFKHHLLTIHFDQVPHVDYVLQRVHQLQDFITLVPEWINYALMDEITDSFAPLIQQIEQQVENLEEYVLHTTTGTDDQHIIISSIGHCRKRVMQLLRLLSSKSDVIRALIKRFEERSMFDDETTSTLPHLVFLPDHIMTMLQNLNHYEAVLARSHTNYLAKVSIELTQTSNATNQVIGRLTIFATVLVPMNLITGLWGMNVKVPGKDYDDLIYFFWILGSLAVFGIISFTLARQM
ncbi:Mg2+ transporter protein, partial [Hesseltinella vesiculosa]